MANVSCFITHFQYSTVMHQSFVTPTPTLPHPPTKEIGKARDSGEKVSGGFILNALVSNSRGFTNCLSLQYGASSRELLEEKLVPIASRVSGGRGHQ